MTSEYDYNKPMRDSLEKVGAELERFTERLSDVQVCLEDDHSNTGCRHTAAFKRASLDLSNILADWRAGRLR